MERGIRDHRYNSHKRTKGHSSSHYKRNRDEYSEKEENFKKTKTSHRRSDEDEKRDFTFTDYKYELNRVISFISNDHISSDLDDFWLFLNKYEAIKKKANQPIQTETTQEDLNEIGIPKMYSKAHFINLEFSNNLDELYSRLPPFDKDYDKRLRLTHSLLEQFLEIVKLYVDFKQKEKFVKLKKLRESQKNLPVAQFKDEIVSAVKNEQVVIIAGDTGCGKSTQVPQYLVQSGFNRIACSQPRRLACISLAKRVAYETLTEHKSDVGYQIRFEKNKNKNTKIIFITEGLLLRQISTESALSSYDVIVLDEVHERHLHGDFLLGVVKCLIHQNPDLKIVLMSATINIDLFSQYFSAENVKVIQVPGRLYPIQLHYRPVMIENKKSKSQRLDPGPYVQILQLIDEKYPENEKGDLLIFLSGMSEITAVVESAKEYSQDTKKWIILPLHSSMSLADQDKVFDYPPEGVRKCIVSTNIAETSITIDGIRFVVDSGKVKEMSYDPTSRMQRLKEFWISRASAEQRKGRAGRTGPGVCYRLYSEAEYQTLDAYSTPELQRVPLDSLILQMVAMGLSDARRFPFIEPPASENIENAIFALKQHGALTEDEKLTSIGHALSRLPVDIVLGKMLIVGSVFHQVEPVLSLAAALSVQTPFTNRAYRDPECQTSRKSLESDHGDPVTLLHAYREWLEVKQEARHGNSQSSRQWCRRRGFEEQRFYEMTKLRTQFKELLQDCSLLNDSTNEAQSSAERAMRHGELKQLKEMRRQHKQTSSRKRKQLKLDLYEIADTERDVDDGIDIKDVEFRMSNDSGKVQNLLSGTSANSYTDLTMLKLILCSGLYPQVAVADEYNYCKSSSEQLFHTSTKAFVSLHPMSFFGNHPEVLQLQEPEIEVPPPGYFSKRPLSSKHQILCYLSLLETVKPYLVNVVRMPAAQTLLLFANTIETSSAFTQIVCDQWLQLEFPVPETGQVLLMKAANLREKWKMLLNRKLKVLNNESVEKTETDISDDLVAYMKTEVCYTLKRLLQADLKTLYVGSDENHQIIEPNPFSEEFKCVPYKRGGMQLTSNIAYNCLIEDEWSYNTALEISQTLWLCSTCSSEYYFTSLEKLQHISTCKKSSDAKADNVESSNEPPKPNSKKYFCTICDKTMYLTSVEILKHRQKHSMNTEEGQTSKR